jgi:hypothetical protein
MIIISLCKSLFQLMMFSSLFLLLLSLAPTSNALTNGITTVHNSLDNPLVRRQSSNSEQVYYGGPIITSPDIFVIFWGPRSSHSFPHKTTRFYQDLVSSSYFDSIYQYSTPDYEISPPTFNGSYYCIHCRAGTVSPSNIRWKIRNLVKKGEIPKLSIYAVHFGRDISITAADASRSCDPDGFCGFHAHAYFTRPPDFFAYTVIPDFRAGVCATRCGDGVDRFDDMTGIATHEVVEAIVDPMIQDAYAYGPPLAWYDVWTGEIGDACAMRHKAVGEDGFVGQEYWSNEDGGCV